MNKQFLIRTAAVIYADNYSSRKTDTIKKKFIEAIFCNNGNTPLTIEEIGNKLSEDMELSFTDSEIEKVVMDKDNFILQQISNKTNDKYSLEKKRFDFLSTKSKDNIDECIKRYLQIEKDNIDNDITALKELLQKYLYNIMNSDIKAFNLVLTGKSTNQNVDKNFDDFSADEITQINNFLSWNDSTKDKELFKMVSFCIEYAIVVNNSNESNLLRSIKNKILYIDNAFLYRALGINGEIRKKRTISFIKKCLESGQELRISKFSKDEFLRTIDYHIKQLENTTPFGRINYKLFRKYSNGDSIYQYYHQWRANRISYGFNIFKSSIVSEYNNLIRIYNILEDYHIPFDNNTEIPEILKYSKEIETIKRKGNKESHDTDAKNMYWIEQKRNGCDGRLIDTKYYFITPDQKLQQWDYHHSLNQPITLLPSQWLAIILKYTSRTNDDYQSYVSFLRIPNKNTDITPENLQEIIAGISEVTEDLQKQGDILDVYIEEEWRRNQLMTSSVNLRENVKEFAKNKQEEYFNQELEKKSQEMINALNKQEQLNNVQIKSLEEEYKQQIRMIEEKTKKEIDSLKIDKLRDELLILQNKLQEKIDIKELIDSKLHGTKRKVIALYVMFLLAWFYLIYKVGWDKMEVWTYIVAVILGIPNFLYKIDYVNKISFKHILNYILEKKKLSMYRKYKFKDTMIDEINNEIKEVNSRISCLEKNL